MDDVTAPVIDDPIVDDVQDPQPDPAPADDAQPDPQPDKGQDQQPADGQPALPKEVAAALKTLRDNPATAKVARTLNDNYFRGEAFRKSFESPAAAAAAKSTLEMLGGDTGIAEIQQQLENMRMVDADIAAGKADYLDDIIQTSPDGFKKLVPAALDKLFNLDKAAYGQAVAPIIAGTLKNYNIPQAIQALQASTDPAAKQAAEILSKLSTDLDNEIRNAPRVDKAEASKTAGEWDKIHSEKVNIQLQAVGAPVLKYQTDAIAKLMQPLLKQKPLSADAKSDLTQGINGEIEKLLKGDKSYQDKVSATLTKIKQLVKTNGDTSSLKSSLVTFINAKMDEIAPKATRAVWNRRYGATPTAQPRVASNGNGQVRSGHLPQKPNVADLDKVPNWDTLYIAHKGYIKGKLVSW
jgi:hypothetical protein